jgi:hypothetical protein
MVYAFSIALLGKSGSSPLNRILYHGTCKVPVHAVLGTCGTGTCGTRYSGIGQVLMTDAVRLAESVVRYALYLFGVRTVRAGSRGKS